MFSIKSYLPQNLVMNILPSMHLWLSGHGKVTELGGLCGVQAHQLTLQLRLATISHRLISSATRLSAAWRPLTVTVKSSPISVFIIFINGLQASSYMLSPIEHSPNTLIKRL